MVKRKCEVTIPNKFGGLNRYEVEASSSMEAIAKCINADKRDPPHQEAVIAVRWNLGDMLNSDPNLRRIARHKAKRVREWMRKRGMDVYAEKRSPD